MQELTIRHILGDTWEREKVGYKWTSAYSKWRRLVGDTDIITRLLCKE